MGGYYPQLSHETYSYPISKNKLVSKYSIIFLWVIISKNSYKTTLQRSKWLNLRGQIRSSAASSTAASSRNSLNSFRTAACPQAEDAVRQKATSARVPSCAGCWAGQGIFPFICIYNSPLFTLYIYIYIWENYSSLI